MEKVQKPVILCVIHHRQNTLDSIKLRCSAAARVRARVWSSGICGGQSGAVAGNKPYLISCMNNHNPLSCTAAYEYTRGCIFPPVFFLYVIGMKVVIIRI
jgi:hypothetical protein